MNFCLLDMTRTEYQRTCYDSFVFRLSTCTNVPLAVYLHHVLFIVRTYRRCVEQAAHHAVADLVENNGYSEIRKRNNLSDDEILLINTNIRYKQLLKAKSDRTRQEKTGHRTPLAAPPVSRAQSRRESILRCICNIRHADCLQRLKVMRPPRKAKYPVLLP